MKYSNQEIRKFQYYYNFFFLHKKKNLYSCDNDEEMTIDEDLSDNEMCETFSPDITTDDEDLWLKK